MLSLCSILLLPHVHAHCTLSLHIIVSIIYLSTCPSLLLNWELLEGKDPHSSLYLKHNAWYRVCGWEDGRMDQHTDRISYNDLECPHTPIKKTLVDDNVSRERFWKCRDLGTNPEFMS